MKRLLTSVCACLAIAAITAAPVAGAKSHKSSSTVSAADAQYLQTSISGDRFEIIGGKLAEKESKNRVGRLQDRRMKALPFAAETSSEIGEGTNPLIRDDAKTELPMLKMHL